MDAEKNIRSAHQPVPSDAPEQLGYRQTIGHILERTAWWDTACRATRYIEQTSDHAWHGAFDIVRREGVTRIDEANNGVADSPNTDTYRMLVKINDDMLRGSSRMYTLQHFTGEPFLHDPLTGESLRALQLQVQEFRHAEEPSNFSMEVVEETTQRIHRSVSFDVGQDNLYVCTRFRGSALLENEHTQHLVDFLDALMPEGRTSLPDGTKRLS